VQPVVGRGRERSDRVDRYRPVRHYSEQGATPYVFVTGGSVITSNTGHASLVGYLVPSN